MNENVNNMKKPVCKRVDDFSEILVSDAFPLISDKPEASTIIFASEVGNGLRQIYFRLTGEPYTNVLEGQNMLVFKHGNHIHQIVEDMFKVNGVWLDSEKRLFDTNNNIFGRVDLVVREIRDVLETSYSSPVGNYEDKDTITGSELKVPVEIKSIKEWGYNDILKTGKPYENHIDQLTVYLKVLIEDYGYKTNFGKLVYFNKNTESIMTWEVLYDKERYDNISAKCAKVFDCVERRKVPGKCMVKGVTCHHINKFPASWCQWRSHYLCHGN